MREILQFYRLGKELGLTKKDLDKIFFSNSYKDRSLGGLILIIFIVFIVFLIILTNFIPVNLYIPQNNTYTEGTLYSTVRIKDFNKQKLKLKKWGA